MDKIEVEVTRVRFDKDARSTSRTQIKARAV